MTASILRPSIDPEFALQPVPPLGEFNAELIQRMRDFSASSPNIKKTILDRPLVHEERRILSADGSGFEIILSIFKPVEIISERRPAIYWCHGGGYHWGDRHHTLEFPLDAAVELNAVCISVEYRLAPEHPHPAPLEDSYSGLVWVSEHALQLGIDPERLIVGGLSAGGGLAAGLALLSRDRNGPKIYAQLLGCPAIDDRMTTCASYQYVSGVPFTRESIVGLWQSYVGKGVNGLFSRKYAAPANFEDLSGLPQAFIDAGSAEVFRDESVEYASKLWAHGVQAELHIWPGGLHGFEFYLPKAALSVSCLRARMEWLKRILSDKE